MILNPGTLHFDPTVGVTYGTPVLNMADYPVPVTAVASLSNNPVAVVS